VLWYGIGYSFDVKCGVRQGGVLSHHLFSVYIDDLINELRLSGHGICIHVGMVFMGCILYPDDIVLLSGSCFGLQKMVDICSNYGHRFDIKFKSTKESNYCFRQACSLLFRREIK